MLSLLARTTRALAAAAALVLVAAAIAGAANARSNMGHEQEKVDIVIDKSQQRMTVYIDGEKRHVFKVSTGKAGHPTPSGTFRPMSMHKMAISRKYGNTPMPHAIFFTRVGHAIHATTAVRNLGRPASHGCIRLSPRDAKTVYDLVRRMGMKNTRIKIV